VNWLAVSVRTGSDDRDAVLDALFAAGSRAVEEIGDDLQTYLPVGTDPTPIVRAIAAASPSARVETCEVLVAEWDMAWRDQLAVQRAGDLTVAPPWLAADLSPATTIVIDPGMAFGTGDHPTTRAMLRLMCRVVRNGDRVADVGAGSAVLSIGAAKLGAASVAAIELDPDAIENAEVNVRANGVGDRVAVLLGDGHVLLPLVAPVRVVLANIVAPVLLALLPAIAQALTRDGVAIVAGIVQEERADFARRIAEADWQVEMEDREENWWSAVLARR
jgi:ribosomal protein L11 methyltransferase